MSANPAVLPLSNPEPGGGSPGQLDNITAVADPVTLETSLSSGTTGTTSSSSIAISTANTSSDSSSQPGPSPFPLATAPSTSVLGTPQASSLGHANSSNGSGLPTGAIVGIAVGAALIVAITVATLFFWKRKRSSQQRVNRPLGHNRTQQGKRAYSSPQHTSPGETEKQVSTVIASALPLNKQGLEKEMLVPQQADDATVTSRFSTLYDQVELHIENFYRDASPVIPPSAEGALSRYDTPLIGAAAAILEESPRATTILKHILSYDITTVAVAPTYGSRRNLLPQDLMTVLNEVQAERQTGEYHGSTTPAYTRLKVLAAKYRFSKDSLSSAAIDEAATQFSHVFSLWSDPRFDVSHRAQHLAKVLESAVTFAIWLLSHPDQFEARWDVVGERSGTDLLVTVPSLIKTTRQGKGAHEVVMSNIVRRRI